MTIAVSLAVALGAGCGGSSPGVSDARNPIDAKAEATVNPAMDAAMEGSADIPADAPSDRAPVDLPPDSGRLDAPAEMARADVALADAPVTDVSTTADTPADRADAPDAVAHDATPEAPDAGGSWPTPLRHVVVIVKENHTFDNYFGSFPGADGTLRADGMNLCTTSKGSAPCARAPDAPAHDLDHSHAAAVVDWAGGRMNGWSASGGSDTGDDLAYAQYTEQDIPNYWQYARRFVLGDRFFANVLAPSFPGHLFPLAAQAGWSYDDPPTDLPGKIVLGPPPMVLPPHPYWGCDEWDGDTVDILKNGVTPAKVFPCFDIPSVPDILPAGIDWKFYGSNWGGLFSEVWSMFDAVKSIRTDPAKWSHMVLAPQFTADLQNHTLPAVTWLVDQDQFSEHPDLAPPGLNVPLGGVCAGEGWTVGYVNQIMQSDYWRDTAIIFTMDDFGGWYDHVPPPRQYGGSAAAPYGLGFRLPLLIMSPYAKPGFIFHEVAEQASIVRFIEKVVGAKHTLHELDSAAQDEQANDLMGAFDFQQAPLPPLVLKARTCP